MNLSSRVFVSLGSMADMGKRFSTAWKQAEAGESVNQTHITVFRRANDV